MVLLFLLVSCDFDAPLNPSENISNIPVVDITLEHEDYLELKSNRTLNREVNCTIKYKGNKYKGEIRASGAGSRYYFKWSYRIELEGDESIEGIHEFNLSAQVEDPTMIRTTLASRLYQMSGFLTFKNFHVFLRFNDDDEGLFSLDEVIKEDYFEKHALPVNELYKLGFSSSFTFNTPNYPEFTFAKQIPDDESYHSLLELINAIDMSSANNVNSTLDKFINLDSYMKYHALTSIMGNIDAFTNNYYLYKRNPDSPFEIIPWDFDKSFYTNSEFGLVGENAIIKKIFQNQMLFNKYKNITKEQMNNLFKIDVIFSIIDSTYSEIEYAYSIDHYLGAGGLNFMDKVEELKEFIRARKIFMLENIDSLEQNYFER